MTCTQEKPCPEFRNIYFVGRNYAAHIEELENERPDRPLIFNKPLSCVAHSGSLPYPGHTQELHFEGEMVFALPGNTEHLDKADQILVGCGIDFTARDVQSAIKAKGWPWFEAKCFRGSAVISTTFASIPVHAVDKLVIETWVNGKRRQFGSYRQKLFPLPDLVRHLASLLDLEENDLLFTGTPSGVGKVQTGDRIQVRLLLDDRKISEATCEVM